MSVTLPTLALGENVCGWANLPAPGLQQGFTVIITNLAVYADYNPQTPGVTVKTFSKIFTFPTAYPRYARFGTQVIGNTLWFSSGSQLGVYAVRPTYSVASVQVLNPGGYFATTPTVVFSDGAGTGATGTATLTGSNLTSITNNAGGSGYVQPPIVSLQGGSTTGPGPGQLPARAVAVLSSFPASYIVQEMTAFTGVSSVALGGTGSGFTSPTVVFIGGGGTGATATAILSTDGLGTIQGIVVDSFGQNYTSVPTVQIIDPTGTGTYTASANLFSGLPFIGGDFMASMAGRLILGGIIGGDGNNTTSVLDIVQMTAGSGYSIAPSVQFVSGGGEGASGYTSVNASGQVSLTGTKIGSSVQFEGILTSGSDVISNVFNIDGLQERMGVSDNLYGIPAATTIASISSASNFSFSGNIDAGTNQIAYLGGYSPGYSYSSFAVGQTIVNDCLPPGTTIISLTGGNIQLSEQAQYRNYGAQFTAIPGSNVTMSANAIQSATEQIVATGFKPGNQGQGYYATPYVNILGNSTSTATAYAQLSSTVQSASSTIRYYDRIAWSAPNAPGYFDPNFLIAPGGWDSLSEARGLISSVNVVESVAFIGHNGGITEMTPNTTSAQVPFSFYPLWGGDQGQIVRYGSMAQFGTTLAFLSQDTGYTLTPNGLTETGQTIANILQFGIPSSLQPVQWNDGSFPLQGLYGSIVLIEGQKHYLIAMSEDQYQLGLFPAGTRASTVFDFNMNENSWHNWTWSGITFTCPIYQSFDTAQYVAESPVGAVQLASDSWILAAYSVTTSNLSHRYYDLASIVEIAPLVRSLQLLSLSVSPTFAEVLAYQFRTEAPSIARMQSERRILLEYENQPTLASLGAPITPSISLTYSGQQDPTSQTGTVVNPMVAIEKDLLQLSAGVVNGQVFTSQVDFGTFTGVCTSLALNGVSNPLVALVRLSQAAVIMKSEVT
jgi:hypothetical protein